MSGELASVKGVVDLSARDALDEALSFLTRLGYRTVRRTDTAITVQRSPEEGMPDQDARYLTVEALPQAEGGVQVTVRGNDDEGVRRRQEDWLGWANGLPKKTEGGQPRAEETTRLLPVPRSAAEPVGGEPGSGHPEIEAQKVIFDKPDQLEKIRAGLLPGEELEAVLDVRGGGTGFVGITSKRVIFQDNAWVMNTKAVVSVPYSRIHTVAAEDAAGLLTGRGYFSSSKIIITTAQGPTTFQFRGADKAHIAHDLILKHMV